MPSSIKKRSSKKPTTEADKKLSIQHLQESVKFNKKHSKDHAKLLKKGGSKSYNKDHIKHHEKAMKEDQKLIKERKKMKLKRAIAQQPQPPATPYFTSSNTFVDQPGMKQQNPNPGQINPMKAKRKLARAMKGYRR